MVSKINCFDARFQVFFDQILKPKFLVFLPGCTWGEGVSRFAWVVVTVTGVAAVKTHEIYFKIK